MYLTHETSFWFLFIRKKWKGFVLGDTQEKIKIDFYQKVHVKKPLVLKESLNFNFYRKHRELDILGYL